MFFAVRFHTGTFFSFDFILNFLKSPVASIMFNDLIFLLGVPRRVKRALAFFPECCRFDPSRTIKQNRKNVSPESGAILSR